MNRSFSTLVLLSSLALCGLSQAQTTSAAPQTLPTVQAGRYQLSLAKGNEVGGVYALQDGRELSVQPRGNAHIALVLGDDEPVVLRQLSSGVWVNRAETVHASFSESETWGGVTTIRVRMPAKGMTVAMLGHR